MSVLTNARRWAVLPSFSLVVPAVAAVGGLLFFAWRPGVALSVLGSARAFGFVVLIGLLIVGLGWALPRAGAGRVTTMVAQAIPVAFAFTVTVLPAFLGSTVDEPLPRDPTAMAGAEPGAEPGSTSSGGSSSTADVPMTVGQGALQGIDHDATGQVRLLRLTDGRAVVRFEGLDVEPGPDYYVHLVPGVNRAEPDGGVQLNRLRASRGNQNYPVPASAPLDRPVTVLIWCRAFAVPVAAATIS